MMRGSQRPRRVPSSDVATTAGLTGDAGTTRYYSGASIESRDADAVART